MSVVYCEKLDSDLGSDLAVSGAATTCQDTAALLKNLENVEVINYFVVLFSVFNG
jgi:hypothetical protein